MCGAATAADTDEVVLLGEGRMLRVALRVEVDGRPLATVWDDAFRTLFASLDRDGDGSLDKSEAIRVPPALRVRQLSWGYFFAHPGDAVPWTDLAGDAKATRLTREQLAAYYRRHGVGGVQVGVGVAPGTDALTRAMLKKLDGNGDGKVSRAEWQAAEKILAALDLNEDEVLTPNELIADLQYPGTQANTLLTPAAADDRAFRDAMPLLRLPADREDTHWAKALIVRRDRDGDGRLDAKEAGLREMFRTLDADGDGKLDVLELSGWRRHPAEAELTIRIGKRGEKDPALEWKSGDTKRSATEGEHLQVDADGMRLTLGAGASQLRDDFETARKAAIQRFGEADANGDGVLEKGEADRSTYAPLRALFAAADRDGDGRITRKEWEGWLDVIGSLTTGQVVLGMVDQGRGLFEFLDADRDGRLSVRELRGAWDRLDKAGCLEGEALKPERLPRQILGAVSVGSPRLPPALVRQAGPAWFRAMDRNRDGDVSAREWVGTVDDFRRTDTNGDGLLSPEEAETARPRKP